MSGLRVGALFAGFGGLEMGVCRALGLNPAEAVAWHSEIEPGPCRILGHHWPDVPNLGDVTEIKWTPDCPECGEPLALYWIGEDAHRAYWCRAHGEFDLSIRPDDVAEPVDVLTGGSPCQDVSAAGKRAGMRPGTRSGLWAAMVDAIDALRPQLVVWENVRGVLSACAHSDLGQCPRCVGDESQPHRPVLRALGRVLGDLADLGYDAQWVGLPASGVGAPHGRFRIFVAATDAGGEHRIERWQPAPGQAPSRWPFGELAGRGRASATDADSARREGHRAVAARTPLADADGDTSIASDASGDGRHEGWPESARLLRRPDAAECCDDVQWGPYEPAIRRWQRVLGRVAPAPTETGPKGGQRLSPRFVEWMMGLPAGHVTAVPGLSRNEQLKALGNGVVPQQAAEAVRWLLAEVAA